MSKIKIQENIDMFLCPICSKKMRYYDPGRIACSDKHSFDLSRKGYINLLLSPAKTDYDKKLFESRNILFKNKFYEVMIEHVSTLILRQDFNTDMNSLKILDAGCGEGSYIAQIVNCLSARSAVNATGFGIDISKDAISIASRNYPGLVWCVGDLTRLPFADNRFNVVLSLLSPSNYAEFGRVISEDGILIKVIPGKSYLEELRRYLYDDTDKENYSNQKVLEHFMRNFHAFDMQELRYKIPIEREALEHLVKMTPLAWRAPAEKVNDIRNSGIRHITIDLAVIAGTKKK